MANSISIPLEAELDLNKNHLTVDSSISKVHDITAPIWNEAWSPLWFNKDTHFDNEVYSDDGDHYYINEGALYNNENKLADILPGFSIKEVDDEDISITDTQTAILSIEDNRIKLSLNYNLLISPVLFTNGVILHKRVKIVNGSALAIVVYNNDEGQTRIAYMRWNGDTIAQTANFEWSPKKALGAANAFTTPAADVSIDDALIWIGYNAENDAYGATVFNTKGQGINPYKDLGWQTIIEHSGYIFDNNTYTTGSQTVSQDVKETFNYGLSVNVTSISTTDNNVALKSGDAYYKYIDDNTPPTETLEWSIGYTPTDTETTLTINGVTYAVYYYTERTTEYTFTLRNTNTNAVLSVEDATNTSNDTALLYLKSNTQYYTVADILNKSAKVTYRNVDVALPSASWAYPNHNGYTISHTYEYTQTITKNNRGAPTLFGEDGYLYGAVCAVDNTTINANVVWSMKATITSITTSITAHTINFESTDYFEFPSNHRQFKGCSVDLAQGHIRWVGRFYGNPSSVAKYYTALFDSALDRVYYGSGVQLDSTVKYDTKTNELPFTSFGSIVDIGNKWRILLNASLPQALSYGEVDCQGTLLTEWGQLDDSYYITGNSNNVIFKDSSGKCYQIERNAENKLTLLFDRYIVINTESFLNCYDIKLGKMIHYAPDWNNRAIPGKAINNVTDLTTYLTNNIEQVNYYLFTTGINSLYALSDTAIMSLSIGPSSYIYTDFSTPVTLLYGRLDWPIDVYYGVNSAIYQYTLEATIAKYKKSKLIGLAYPISSGASSYFTPNIFTEYIPSYNNKDMVKSGRYSYLLNYIYGTEPSFSWSTSSQQEDVEAIFVIQGQFYGIINEKLYSLVYSGQTLVQAEAIIDVTGLQYLGFIPTIAYFYSPMTHALYSFTGDANLTLLKECTDWNTVNGSWFNTATQTLFIQASTDNGEYTYVFAPANTFRLNIDTKNMFFLNDGVTVFIGSNNNYLMSYSPRENAEPYLVTIETMLYGPDSNKWNNITKWTVQLMADSRYQPLTSEYKHYSFKLTDHFAKSKEKTVSLRNEDWHLVGGTTYTTNISITPEMQKGQGQGISLTVPYAIKTLSFETGIANGVTPANIRRQS